MRKNSNKKRVTIMIDGNNQKKLHKIQAEKIRTESKSVSFSAVLNEILEKSLKN